MRKDIVMRTFTTHIINRIMNKITKVLYDIIKLTESKDVDILEIIKNYNGTGNSGDCGNFAICLNKEIGGIGRYLGVINPTIWDLGEYRLNHVLLMVDNVMYDSGGIFTTDKFSEYSSDENDQDLYNMTDEETDNLEVVDLSDLWGSDVEDNIREWTG